MMICASCMICSLPVGDFRFLIQGEVDSFDVNSISDDAPVEADMLSPTLEQMYDHVSATHIPSTKLISNIKG